MRKRTAIIAFAAAILTSTALGIGELTGIIVSMYKELPVLLAIVVIGIAALSFWSSRPGTLPSSFFRMMDRDHDSDVTYAEWKAELQTKSDWAQREWDFHAMDCNSDQRLTWPEYRWVVFKGGARCGKNSDIATRPRSPGSFSYCDTNAQTGVQRCVIGSGDAISGLSAGPMQPLEIPE